MMQATPNPHNDHHASHTNNNHNHRGSNSFEDPAPNLDVIFAAFGDDADLYKDVLQVKSNASSEQIQMAYFDRRSELFALLASIDSEEEQDDITASHRFHAERKMDAVVMAVRILGDVSLRQEYDHVLHARLQQPPPPQPQQGGIQSVGSTLSKGSSCREPDGVYAGVVHNNISIDYQEDLETLETDLPLSSQQQPSHSPRRVSPNHRPMQDGDDDEELPPQRKEYRMHQHPEQHPSPSKHTNSTSTSSTSSKHHKRGRRGKTSSTSKTSTAAATAHHPNTSHQHHHHYHPPVTPTTEYPQAAAAAADVRALEDDDLDDEDDEESKTWDNDGQGTVTSLSTTGWTQESGSRRAHSTTLSTMTHHHGGMLSRIKEEVSGTVEDTLVSFEQVLNVFTLQEKDIKAVVGRIDKAKRQLRKRR